MITLRCTRNLLQHLGQKPEVEERRATSSLGDWYGNLVPMPTGPSLVLVCNERCMLGVVLDPEDDLLASFRRRAVALLRRQGVLSEPLEREAFHLQVIHVGKTRDRRVLGSMNDAAWQLQAQQEQDPFWPHNLEQAEDLLAENVYSMLGYRQPGPVARDLLGLAGDPGGARRGGRPRAAAEPPPLAPVLDLALPDKPTRRRRPAAGATVPVRLSLHERRLVLQSALLEPELTARLEDPLRPELAVRYTAEEMEQLLACLAAEINHCGERRRKLELDRLYEKLRRAFRLHSGRGLA